MVARAKAAPPGRADAVHLPPPSCLAKPLTDHVSRSLREE